MRIPTGILATALALTLAVGCSGSSKKEHSAEVFAMDTLIFLSAWGEYGHQAVQQGESYLYYIEDKFSTTRTSSELSQLNAGAGQWQSVSDDMAQVIVHALALSKETGGAFDPTIHSILTTWGFTTDSFQVPDPTEIHELMPYVGAEKIKYNEKTQEVLIPKGFSLDFGGIAKGYAGDELANAMEEAGVKTGLLTLGGNVVAIGRKTDGAMWNIGIQNPSGGGALASVAIEDKAVVTSGGYQRYFAREGELYGHIIDPTTGYPAQSGLTSVTIITDSALEGDVLSTALFVMGVEKGADYWREHQDFEAVFITDEGDIFITQGIHPWFTLASGYTEGTLRVITP